MDMMHTKPLRRKRRRELLRLPYVGQKDAFSMDEQPERTDYYMFAPKGVFGNSLIVTSISFLILALISYCYAELYWYSATNDATSIGVGVSTYSAIGFLRSIVFAAISAASGVAGMAVRRARLMTPAQLAEEDRLAAAGGSNGADVAGSAQT